MHAKSLASFESVENDVRTIAFAASSTTEMRRVHSTSSVIASKRVVTASPSRARSTRSRGYRADVGMDPPAPQPALARQSGFLQYARRGVVVDVAHGPDAMD